MGLILTVGQVQLMDSCAWKNPDEAILVGAVLDKVLALQGKAKLVVAWSLRRGPFPSISPLFVVVNISDFWKLMLGVPCIFKHIYIYRIQAKSRSLCYIEP